MLEVSRTIKDYDGIRENNFTLVRLVFAYAVLFGHGYAIAGDGLDPITATIGVWIGDIAVNGFFVISGFLVAGSYNRSGAGRYIMNRIMRIYPGLFVCVLTCIIIGAFVSSNDFATYIRSPLTAAYFSNSLLYQLHWYLPG